MRISTKFKIDDFVFIVRNNEIKKVQIKKINIEVFGDNNGKMDITYSISKSNTPLIESQLGETPHDAVNFLVEKYRKHNPQDFEYENYKQESAIERATGDRTSALEIDTEEDEDEGEEEDEDISQIFLNHYANEDGTKIGEKVDQDDGDDEEDDDDIFSDEDDKEDIPF